MVELSAHSNQAIGLWSTDGEPSIILDALGNTLHCGYPGPEYDTAIDVASMMDENWTRDDETFFSGYSVNVVVWSAVSCMRRGVAWRWGTVAVCNVCMSE